MKLTYNKNYQQSDIYLISGNDEEYILLSKILGYMFENHIELNRKNGFNTHDTKILNLYQNTISALNYECMNLTEYNKKLDKVELLTDISNDYKFIQLFRELMKTYLEEMKLNEFQLSISVNSNMTTNIIKELFIVE